MSEHSELLNDPGSEDLFEREMRGYSRRRVDEFVARSRSQIRDLEDRLSQAIDDSERLRHDLATARQESADKPAHEEISERVGQILKLADEEAKAQRNRAGDEITRLRDATKAETDKQRADTKAETDKIRAEAQDQAERMLSAAQEQAEHSVATARAEAEKMRTATRTEADRVVAEANKHAENAVAAAKAQAKQQLDEATARATAIHDGAERRLNLLTSRHTEAIRRLTEIRDVVTTLVAGENSRGSLEDEVNKAVAGALGHQPKQGGADGRHATGPAKPGIGQQSAARNEPAVAGEVQRGSAAADARGPVSAARAASAAPDAVSREAGRHGNSAVKHAAAAADDASAGRVIPD